MLFVDWCVLTKEMNKYFSERRINLDHVKGNSADGANQCDHFG